MPLGRRLRSPGGGVGSAFLFIFKRHNIRPSLRLGARGERASSRSPHPTNTLFRPQHGRVTTASLLRLLLQLDFLICVCRRSESSPPTGGETVLKTNRLAFQSPRDRESFLIQWGHAADEGNAELGAGGSSISGHGSTSIISLRRSGGSERRCDCAIWAGGLRGL
jgi:hypothetical protein